MLGNKLKSRVGRRGASLILMGIIWFVIGLGLLLGVATGEERDLIHVKLPYPWRGTLWIASAAIAFFCAFKRGQDAWGFTALMIMPLVRSLSHLWGSIAYLASGGAEGFEYGFLYTALYGGLVGWVYVTGGWSEPLRLPKEYAGGHHG